MSGVALELLRPSAAPRALRRLGPAAGAAAGLSLAAAWVHLAYTASHWQDWWAYGAFFLGTGIFQAACVPAIVVCLLTLLRARPRRLVVNLLLAGGATLWILRLTDHLP